MVKRSPFYTKLLVELLFDFLSFAFLDDLALQRTREMTSLSRHHITNRAIRESKRISVANIAYISVIVSFSDDDGDTEDNG